MDLGYILEGVSIRLINGLNARVRGNEDIQVEFSGVCLEQGRK